MRSRALAVSFLASLLATLHGCGSSDDTEEATPPPAPGALDGKPFPPASLSDFTIEPSLGVPVSKTRLLVLFAATASADAVAAAVTSVGGRIAGSAQGIPLALVLLDAPGAMSATQAWSLLVKNPAVEAVAEDMLLLPDTLPTRVGGPGAFSYAASPSLGLRWMGAPAAWNLVPYLRSRNTAPVHVGVLETEFAASVPADLQGVFTLRAGATPHPGNHGTNVAGVIGALWNDAGVDGVTPFVRITGAAHAMDLRGTPTQYAGASFSDLFLELDGLLALDPPPRVVNISLGYNWYRTGLQFCQLGFDEQTHCHDIRCNPTVDAAGCPAALIQARITNHARMFASRVSSRPRPPLFTTAAGNDGIDANNFSMLPARWASPWNRAAYPIAAEMDPPRPAVDVGQHILVTEALEVDAVGTAYRADYSNVTRVDAADAGGVFAPGRNLAVLVASPANASGESPDFGTSLAAPHVAGVAAFLLALEPGLANAQLRTCLTRGAAMASGSMMVPSLDMLAAVRCIDDQVPGRSPKIRTLLADLDDGTPDGFTRDAMVPPKTAAAFAAPHVDMADFRAFRDARLLASPQLGATFGCPSSVASCDLNLDTRFENPQTGELYPRAQLHRGASGLGTEDVAALSAAWDPPVTDPAAPGFDPLDPQGYLGSDLAGLATSADLHVDAAAFLAKAGAQRLDLSLGGATSTRPEPLHGIPILASPVPPIVTTPILGAPSIEVTVAGHAPLTATLPTLKPGEDRTLVLNPCVLESPPKGTLLEPPPEGCAGSGGSGGGAGAGGGGAGGSSGAAGSGGGAGGALGDDGGGSVGEPHLTTFDGLLYDVQILGELDLVHEPGGLRIQTRHQPFGTSTSLAVNTMVATRAGADRVTFDVGGTVRRNGAPVTVDAPTALDGGATLLPDGADRYRLTFANGDVLRVARAPGPLLDVRVSLAPRAPGAVRGLLGWVDGSVADDLRSRDGTPLPPGADKAAFRSYVESWFVPAAESLFDYQPGETTEGFRNPLFPSSYAGTGDLTKAQYDAARATCEAAGVVDPYLLDACILDVAILGPTAAARFTGVAAPKSSYAPATFATGFETPAGFEWTYLSGGLPAALPIVQAPGSASTAASRLAGPFGNADPSKLEAPQLTLNDLPPHDRIVITYDLVAIGSWTGNASPTPGQVFLVQTGGEILRTTFSLGSSPQSFPGLFPVASNPPGSGALPSVSLGLGQPHAVFRVRRTFAHDGGFLSLQFGARDLPAGATWALDNLRIDALLLAGSTFESGMAHGPPGAPGTVGCSDGRREAFLDVASFPNIAGCWATWDNDTSMAAAPTGKPCGENLAACAVPADACASGWHVCGASGSADELLALDPFDCNNGGTLPFLAAVSRCQQPGSCATASAGTTLSCNPPGDDCAGTLACGSPLLVNATCGDTLWKGWTPSSNGACGQLSAPSGAGVLCCRD